VTGKPLFSDYARKGRESMSGKQGLLPFVGVACDDTKKAHAG